MTLTRGHGTNTAMVALDQRRQDAAQIVASSDGTPRTGVLGGHNTGIVATTAATGPMTVTVAAADFVCSKGVADGVTLPTNDGSVSVTINAAPGSNSRITVIWVKQQDSTTGDGANTPIFGTTDGTAAGSPTKPAIPTGALELATLRVYSGTTSSNGGSNLLTNTYQMTAARGGVVSVRNLAERDAWTNPAPGQLVHDLSTGLLYRRHGSAWIGDDRSIMPTSVSGTGATLSTSDVILSGATGNINIAIPFSSRFDHYRIELHADTVSADAGIVMQLRAGGSAIAANYYGSYEEIAIGVGRTKSDISNTASFACGRIAANGGAVEIDLYRPTKVVGNKVFQCRSVDAATYRREAGGYCSASTGSALDGIVIGLGAVTVNAGRIRVIGVA